MRQPPPDLTYDRPTDAPPTIVAKLPAADETSRATALSLRSYENEVRFYQQLAPGLPMRTPARVLRRHRRRDGQLRAAPRGPGAGRAGRPARRLLAGAGQGRGGRAGAAARAPLGRPGAGRRSSGCTATRRTNQQFMPMLLPDAVGRLPRALRAPTSAPTVHQAGDALFADLDAVPGAEHADRGRSSTATTGSTTCCSTRRPGGAPDRRRRLADRAPTARPCSDVAYFIGAGLIADDRRRGRGATSSATTTRRWSPPASPATTGTAAGTTTAGAPGPG